MADGEVTDLEHMLETLKQAAAALRDARIPFALTGGLACWARGGPDPQDDVDLLVPPERAEDAADALRGAGMEIERPPEEWLLKAHDHGVLVDLIFEPAGLHVPEALARAEELQVQAMAMPVAAVEDLLVSMLLAVDEQDLDLASPLEVARALREQVDWEEVWERTAGSPFAAAFRTLLEGLEIVTP